MQLQLHYITQHYTTLRYATTTTATTSVTTTKLHYTTLHQLHYTHYNYNYTTLHHTRLHYTIPHYSTQHYSTLQYSTLQYTTLITPHHSYNYNCTTLITHYNYNSTTPHYNYNCNCATPRYIQQLWSGDHCNHCNHSKKHNSNHLSVHQWIRSAIRDSQQPTSPIGFLFLNLPPPPCAVLLVYRYTIKWLPVSPRCSRKNIQIDYSGHMDIFWYKYIYIGSMINNGVVYDMYWHVVLIYQLSLVHMAEQVHWCSDAWNGCIKER